MTIKLSFKTRSALRKSYLYLLHLLFYSTTSLTVLTFTMKWENV